MRFSSFLAGEYRVVGRHEDWRVCGDNVFMMERWVGLSRSGYETRPNWALIVPIIAVVVLVAAAILLYRNWRKGNYCPIYFAGKVKYVRKGTSLRTALSIFPAGENGLERDWLDWQCKLFESYGIKVVSLYTDAALSVLLDRSMKVYGPLQIFPKLKRKDS